MNNVKKIQKVFKIVFALCLFIYVILIVFFKPNLEILSMFIIVSILPIGLLVYSKMSYSLLSLINSLLLVFYIFMPLFGFGAIKKIYYVIIPLVLFNFIYGSIIKWDINKKTGILKTVNNNIYVIAIINLLYLLIISFLFLHFR